MPNTYTDVTVQNRRGQTVKFRFPDNERGESLIETLKSKARREELDKVSTAKASKKGAEYPGDAEPPRRRGRPVDGAVEASAVVETDGNDTTDDGKAKS